MDEPRWSPARRVGSDEPPLELLAARGARVIAAARRQERLEELAGHSESIRPLRMDIRDRTAVDAALPSLPDDWRQVDILVNAAGVRAGERPAPGTRVPTTGTR